MVTRVVLRGLMHSRVHGRGHASVHVHIVRRMHVPIRVRGLLLSLGLVIIVLFAILLYWIHSVVLISLSLIVLLLLCRQLLIE
jgi:hypothetical protein